jgi:hypothetical protein
MFKDTLKVWLCWVAFFSIIGAGKSYAVMADCTPPVRADGTTIGFDWVDGPVGRHVFFFCTDTLGRIRDEGVSCRSDVCNAKTLTDVATQVLAAPDRKKAIADAEAKYLKWTCKAPPAAEVQLCVERARIWQENYARWTQGYTPPTFRVKANPACDPTKPPCTRPAYPLVNDVVGTTVAKDATGKEVRAPVGALCRTDTPTATATGTDIRGQWADGPAGVVTICSKGASQ